MTKIGEQEDRAKTASGTRRTAQTPLAKGFRPERPLLFATCLSLLGCSLAAPKEGELFAPSSAQYGDAAARDAAVDAAPHADGGASPDIDSGELADAGPDQSANDAGDSTDAAEDAGPTVFDPAAGLVVHYRFNETTGNTVNDFAGDKDALIFGTPMDFEQWVSPGRVDGALKLSGATPTDGGVGHYVELPQGILLGMQQCTIALWMNRTGGPVWQRVFDFGSGQPDWIYFTALGPTGLPVVAGRTPALIFVDYLAVPNAPAGQGELQITQPIAVGTWVHVALTWTDSLMTLYLNGKQAGQTMTYSMVKPTDLGNTSQNYLGRSQFAPDPYFNGMLDEFRIYNRALSDSDVAALYNLQ